MTAKLGRLRLVHAQRWWFSFTKGEVLPHQGSPGTEKRDREVGRLVFISCYGCVLSITRDPSGPARKAEKGVNPPRFVHSDSTTWSLVYSWLWDLTLLFHPFMSKCPWKLQPALLRRMWELLLCHVMKPFQVVQESCSQNISLINSSCTNCIITT